jgi:hypothetical protein
MIRGAGTRYGRSVRAAIPAVAFAVLAVPAGAGAGASAREASAAPDSPSHAKPIRGLRARPDHPVRSIALRPGQAAHHPIEPGRRARCDKDVDLTGQIFGVTPVADQNNGICTSADIDVYATGAGSYVVQGGGEEAAWTHTDVSDPANPSMVGQFVWVNQNGRPNRGTYTPDIKAFKQESRRYTVMGLERLKVRGFCGVVIVDVTDPANPVLMSQFIGSESPGGFWCDTHNVFVENDSSGDGKYIYATADATNDMRVLQISPGEGAETASVSNPIEVGRYTSPTADVDNYVHDITVIDHAGERRAYLAYWDSGLVILNPAGVTPGVNPTPLVGPNVIDPAGFLAHHAYPNASGSRVFVQDEISFSASFEPVQMWNIDGIPVTAPTKLDGITADVGQGGELVPAHNLHVTDDTLYVGWYKAGLQAFSFTDSGIDTRSAYHQVQTEARDDSYDGAWGVRLLTIDPPGGEPAATYVFQSDRRYGLIIDKQ